MAALQHLPPRQRAVLILCEVLRWKASEVAELLETSVASVNSALQRARATLETSDVGADRAPRLDEADRELLARYVGGLRGATTSTRSRPLIHEDATQSMPPFDLWLSGRDDIFDVVARAGHRLPRLARDPDEWRPTARRPSGSTSRANPAAASTRGRCRCSRSQTAGSSS